MNQHAKRRVPHLVLLLAGLALLLAGLVGSWQASKRQGHDYACVYLTASGLINGSPIYDHDWQQAAFPSQCGIAPPQGMFYPPATGLATLPLGLLSYPLAHSAWFILMAVVVVLGIRALLRLVRPDCPAYEWLIASGLVLLSSCLRWGMTAQQGAPLILGLLSFFVVALHRRQLWLAFAIAAFAISFKTTLALPFAGLLFLHRHYVNLAASLGTWVVLNVVGFARLGGFAALKAYQHNVAHLEALDDINTPDPWRLVSVPRLDWIYLFDGLLRHLPAARLAALVCAALVGMWLLWQALRVRGEVDLTTTACFLLPFVCLTNLSVYHHHYDISIIWAPGLVFLLGSPQLRKPSWAIWLMLPLLAVITLLPVAKVQFWTLAHFGSIGRGLVNLMFPITVTLTLAGSMVILRTLVNTQRERSAPESFVQRSVAASP